MNYGSLIPEYTRLTSETQRQDDASGQSVLRYLLDTLQQWRHRR
jgi:hypothetical protein